MRNWQLFAVAVGVWSTTWHAILYQLAHTSAEYGVALRFGLAGVGVLAWAAATGKPWWLDARSHARVAFQGLFMYSLSYLCVYHAERHVASGLVAVGYSASPLVNGVASHVLWRTPLTRRLLWGGICGLLGVVLIFWPELSGAWGQRSVALGMGLTIGAVLLSSVGALATSRNGAHGLALWPSMGWGMVYGAACSLAVVVATGQDMSLPAAPSWWLSLGYLAALGSVVAFACYLVLQQRLGPGQASMVGVATPVLALAVSAAFEGYRPGLLALIGAALAVMGNWLALRRPVGER